MNGIVRSTGLSAPRPWIAGVLNCTPDSFSDGGSHIAPASAIAAARTMTAAGAHIIDIGGESTRPGSTPIDAHEELSRIEPVVAALAGELHLSIDTYKAQVAERCLSLGAKMVNDVSMLRADPQMGEVCAKYGALVMMMFSKEAANHPHASHSDRSYADPVQEIAASLLERAEYAVRAGVLRENIIFDPGMGRFLSNDPAISWQVLRELPRFVKAVSPYPVAICTSRKGFLGGVLAERDALSQFTAAHAVRCGAALVRTHNVPMLRSFLDAAGKLE